MASRTQPRPASADDVPFERHPATGAILATSLDNVRLALAALHLAPTYDEFRRTVCLAGDPVTDTAVDLAWVAIIDQFGFRPSLDLLRRVITTEAAQRPVHPVRHYLDGLQWDGQPRLDTWLSVYGGAADTPYVRAVGALPLLAAVRRIAQPGSKFDELLTLEGPQGIGKSSMLRTLCPDAEWFSDDLPLGVDSKQVIERTSGKWLIEAAELHGHSGREAEQIKAFLSRGTDGPVRLAYDRFATSVPRQFVLVATTNSTMAYLKDSTGGRRFWPVRVTQFDVARLQQDRDQLWAEAAARERAGASVRLDGARWADASEAQEARRAVDPWEEVLEPLFIGDGLSSPTRVPTATCWTILGATHLQRDNRCADRIARIAARHGFTKRRARLDGRSVQCWVRDGDTTEEDA